ncbi:hypothetical protein AOQ72_15275 [Bradyrhizobium yuanmingense]|uniref:Uncharacterized protein n=1 Tax=Bradyrhizobium yuanmingense TaxID=108015 RepID=A0A0R3CN43_9BRAD|nr:hypothetical protein AOQ72_15275 [Bradyrhizobium yuanmingense]
MGHHSTPADAARVFAECAPGLAVYNHLVLIDDGKSGPPTVQELMDRTRQGYDGAVVVGEESHGLLPLNFGSRAGVTPTPSPRRA